MQIITTVDSHVCVSNELHCFIFYEIRNWLNATKVKVTGKDCLEIKTVICVVIFEYLYLHFLDFSFLFILFYHNVNKSCHFYPFILEKLLHDYMYFFFLKRKF